MNFLIIGGAGFIGYHLAYNLSKNKKNNIDIVDNLQRGRKDSEFLNLIKKKNIFFIKKNFVQIKINTMKKNYDYIFHLASIVGVKNVVNNPTGVMRQNIDLIYKIIELAKLQKNLKKICFTSTSEIYANSVFHKIAKVPTKEKDLIVINNYTSARDSYFLSKLISEKILYLSKLPFVILRLHNIYGPRMGYSHVIPEIFLKIKRNEKKVSVLSWSHSRAFCYVTDAIDQIKFFTTNRKIKNIVLNIGNDKEEIKIINLTKKILKILGLKIKIIKDKNMEGSPKRRCPDLKLNYKLIKRKPLINLHSGLIKTYLWYKKFI